MDASLHATNLVYSRIGYTPTTTQSLIADVPVCLNQLRLVPAPEAAECVFSVRGFARTAPADIAASAGVNRGAIYWHFESREALFSAVLDSLANPLEQALQQAAVSERDALGALKKFLIGLFESFIDNPRARRLHEVVFHKCELVDELCDLRFQRQRVSERWDKHLEMLFEGAKTSGQ